MSKTELLHNKDYTQDVEPYQQNALLLLVKKILKCNSPVFYSSALKL